MRVGDVLEIVAGVCLTVGAGSLAGTGVALIVAGIVIGYIAQCYGTTELPRISRERGQWRVRLRRPAESTDTAQAAA
jgi:hypothetical protein